ncbi:hypothetical protein K413DRAFT_2419 [Clostridium sp. ASBs410]|jgi:hypothetical protein|nr:hypothetical protein K413DRAFT_2419 [Clostridium sp. ASBs410]
MENQKTYAEELMQKLKEIDRTEEQEIYGIENNIHNGFIIVKYKKMDMEEKELLDGAFTMLLPAEFELMDKELAKMKYPGGDRPDYIYTNEDTTVNITFTLEDSGLISNDEVEEVKNILAKQMKRLYPGSKIEDSQPIQAGDKSVSLFSFDVPLIDGNVYNLMFFMECRKHLLMGAFNCSIHQKKQWKPLIRQMLMTIKEPQQCEGHGKESR